MKIQTFQKIRVTILTLSFILFPVTLNYLSPVVSMMGAAAGIITGSIMVFCGQCIDTCKRGTIAWAWRSGR